MADHQSAIKRHRQSLRRRARNRVVRAKAKGEIKKLHAALEQGDPAAITKQLRETAGQLKKTASKGVMKKKTVSRRIGRLAKAAHKKLTSTN